MNFKWLTIILSCLFTSSPFLAPQLILILLIFHIQLHEVHSIQRYSVHAMYLVGMCFESLADYRQPRDFLQYKLREIKFIYVCIKHTHTHTHI
jgi:hypothetical protein